MVTSWGSQDVTDSQDFINFHSWQEENKSQL